MKRDKPRFIIIERRNYKSDRGYEKACFAMYSKRYGEVVSESGGDDEDYAIFESYNYD